MARRGPSRRRGSRCDGGFHNGSWVPFLDWLTLKIASFSTGSSVFHCAGERLASIPGAGRAGAACGGRQAPSVGSAGAPVPSAVSPRRLLHRRRRTLPPVPREQGGIAKAAEGTSVHGATDLPCFGSHQEAKALTLLPLTWPAFWLTAATLLLLVWHPIF